MVCQAVREETMEARMCLSRNTWKIPGGQIEAHTYGEGNVQFPNV